MELFPWLAGILLSYCVLTQLLKGIWVRKYGWSVRCRGRRQSGEMHEEALHLRGVGDGRPGPWPPGPTQPPWSGAEVQIYGVVDAGVAVTNVSGVGSRSGMLNGGLTDSLWGLQGRPGRRLERALPAGKRLRPVHGTAGR